MRGLRFVASLGSWDLLSIFIFTSGVETRGRDSGVGGWLDTHSPYLSSKVFIPLGYKCKVFKAKGLLVKHRFDWV